MARDVSCGRAVNGAVEAWEFDEMSFVCVCDSDFLISDRSAAADALANREGVGMLPVLVAEPGGVDCRRVDGDEGDSGLRKGEPLVAPPKLRGEGL